MVAEIRSEFWEAEKLCYTVAKCLAILGPGMTVKARQVLLSSLLWARQHGLVHEPVYMCGYGCIWQSIKKIERNLENNLSCFKKKWRGFLGRYKPEWEN